MGDLCASGDSENHYNICILGAPLSGKAMLINMFYTLLSKTLVQRKLWAVAPKKPTFQSCDSGRVTYESYNLREFANVPLTFFKATPITQKTAESEELQKLFKENALFCDETTHPVHAFVIVINELETTEQRPGVLRYLTRFLSDQTTSKPPVFLCVRSEEKTIVDVKKLLKVECNPRVEVQSLPRFDDLGEASFKRDLRVGVILTWCKKQAFFNQFHKNRT